MLWILTWDSNFFYLALPFVKQNVFAFFIFSKYFTYSNFMLEYWYQRFLTYKWHSQNNMLRKLWKHFHVKVLTGLTQMSVSDMLLTIPDLGWLAKLELLHFWLNNTLHILRENSQQGRRNGREFLISTFYASGKISRSTDMLVFCCNFLLSEQTCYKSQERVKWN